MTWIHWPPEHDSLWWQMHDVDHVPRWWRRVLYWLRGVR